jgi:hypothetical protein
MSHHGTGWHKPNKPGWTIRMLYGSIKFNTAWLQEKQICYVSPNTKAVGPPKNVFLSSQEIAEEFATAITPIMHKRHGDDLQLLVEPIEQSHKRNYDDAMVIARIAAKNFAPNKAVSTQ